MTSYPIPPEDCLVVHALNHSESLRQAAKRLGCDPAGLLRKVQRIASDHGLLQKQGGKWRPTERGKSILAWVEESVLAQRSALDAKRAVRIASTAWLFEQLLVPNLAALSDALPEAGDFHLLTPEKGFEAALRNGEIDFVVACHPPEDPAFAHRKVGAEEWIAIVPTAWAKSLRGKSARDVRELLAAKPFIRHNRLNPDVLFASAEGDAEGGAGNGAAGAASVGSISITVDHLVGVRAAVSQGLGWSCVPSILVRDALAAKEVARADLPVVIRGDVCVWWSRDQKRVGPAVSAIEGWLRKACRARNAD